MIGLQYKIIAGLAVLAVAAGFYIKHLIYQQGFRDAGLRHAAAAAERSIESERRAGKSLAASERARAEGLADVAALRRRAEKHAADARAARERARKMQTAHRESVAHAQAARADARAARADAQSARDAARTANDRALALAAGEGCPPAPEPETCPADLPLRQP